MQGAELQLLGPLPGLEGPLALLDFPLAWEEYQHRFLGLAPIEPVLLQGPNQLAGQGFQRPGRLVGHLDSKAATLTSDLLGLGPLVGQGGQVQGGGHHQQAQIGRQHRARFPHQGQG